MIKQIKIYQTNTLHFTNRLYHNKKRDVIYEFNDDINIITGRNGSGKSVLLKLIKTACGIDDYSYPAMIEPIKLLPLFSGIEKTIPEYIQDNIRNYDYPNIEIDWDGNMVHYLTPKLFNPNDMFLRMDSPYASIHKKELFQGIEILEKMTSNRSQGENVIQILLKLYNLSTDFDEPLTNVNDTWIKASNIYQNWLKSFPVEKGKPTLLIDELDGNLDLDNQNIYWDYIKHLTNKWQIIVVSHSIFAFKQKNVNFINLNPSYFNKVKKL